MTTPSSDDGHKEVATYCPDCGTTFFDDEEGFDQEECFECGETNCYEVTG